MASAIRGEENTLALGGLWFGAKIIGWRGREEFDGYGGVREKLVPLLQYERGKGQVGVGNCFC